MLKRLGDFEYFDFVHFSEGKKFMALSQRDWIDPKTKNDEGIKLETVITEDNTVYKDRNGQKVTNVFEKLVFKVRKKITVPPNSYVVPVDPVAVVWGDFRGNLSVTCSDVEIVADGGKEG